MYERSQALARNLTSVSGERKKQRARALKTDRTLQLLVADLVAARTAAGLTQEAAAVDPMPLFIAVEPELRGRCRSALGPCA